MAQQSVEISENCGMCRWKHKTACTVNPPTPMFMPRENPLTRAVSPQLVGVYPPVQDDTMTCQFFQRKVFGA